LDYNIESGRENVFIPTHHSVSFPAVKSNEAYNGYYSLFPPQDLTAYPYLVFWAKGDTEKGYTRSFKIELSDGVSPQIKSVQVSGLSGEWQRFTIPLSSFEGLDQLSTVQKFVLVFSGDSVTRKTGTIYLDDIYFAEHLEQNVSLPDTPVTAVRRDQSPRVDGLLKEWPRSSWNDVSGAIYVERGSRGNKADASARYAVSWDDQWLYVAVALKDNEILNKGMGDDLWRGDCVEIYLNPRGQDMTWGDSRSFQLGFSPSSSAGNPALWAWFQRRSPTKEEAYGIWSEDRKSLEVAVSWSFLGGAGSKTNMGYSFSFHDADEKDGTPDCKLTSNFSGLGSNKFRLGKLVFR